MKCVKTGCTAYLNQYGEYAHGDLFELNDGQFLMRVCYRGLTAPRNTVNLVVTRIEHWFDKDIVHSTSNNSTMLIADFKGWSYPGAPLNSEELAELLASQ